MKKHVFLIIIQLCVLSILVNAQIGEAIITLNSTTFNPEEHFVEVARDKVIFVPPFTFKPAIGGSLEAYTNPNLLVSADYILPGNEIDPTTRGLDKSLPVGNTPTVFNVNQMGAANYTVPIQVAPGTAGMQPQIALSYNSQAGNGLCGVGWNFSAVSAITRVGKTVYHDGDNGNVSLSSSDRFALDGQRLIFENGYNYEYNNSTYRKELDDFSKITAKGYTNTTRADYFIVEEKNGIKKYYGRVENTDSKAFLKSLSSDYILAWYLYKIEDIHGNYMIYNYEQDETNGETWLTSIEYTGNEDANLDLYNKVEFNYEVRTDQSESYIKDCKLTNSRILKHIRTYAEGELVRKYELQYFFDKKTKLNEIVEFNANGEYYNSIVVGYGEGSDLMTKKGLSLSSPMGISEQAEFYFGDFNGDGVMDFIRVYVDKDIDDKWYYFCQLYYGRSNLYYDLAHTDKYSYSTGTSLSFIPGDFNGNGITDVMFFYNNYMDIWKAVPGSSEGFQKTGLYSEYIIPSDVQVGDFDGDGKMEFCTPTLYYDLNSDLTTVSNTGVGLLPSTQYLLAQVMDINADGKSDIVYKTRTNSLLAYTISSSGESQISISDVPVAKNTYFGHFNDDAYPDILQWNVTTGWKLYINKNGSTFITGNAPPLPDMDSEAEFDNNNISVVDISGDGKSEVLLAVKNGTTDTKVTVYSDLGGVWNSVYDIIKYITPVSLKYHGFFDINGDGYQDLLYRKYSNPNYSVVAFNYNSHENFVENIRDGQGNLINIAYNRINDGSGVYSKGTGPSFPIIESSGPLYVVKSYTKHNNNEVLTSNNSYTYGGLKYHRLGKGILGFSTVYTTNLLRNTLKQDFYAVETSNFHHYLLSSKVYLGGSLITETSNSISLESTVGKAYWAKPVETVAKDKQNFVNTYLYYDSFDAYGNPTISRTVYFDTKSGTEEAVLQETTTTIFDILNGTYYPNIPTKITKENLLVSTQEQKSQVVDFVYSGVNLDYKIVNDASSVEVKEDYTFDVCGNLLQKGVYDGSNTLMATVSYTYEANKRFVATATNALGHTIYSSYEPKYGNILSQTNAIGLTTEYQYDAWGKLVSNTTPFGKNTIVLDRYSGTEFSNAEYYKHSVSLIGSEKYEYYDIEGQRVNEKSRGFNGEWIYTSWEYDVFGRLVKESKPYKISETPKLTEYSYDSFNRINLVSDHTNNEDLFSYSYAGIRKVTTTDLMGGSQDNYKEYNAIGQLIKAHDNGGDITYEYDALGNMVTVNSPGGTTTMTYDLAGNKRSMSDADAGTYTYTYDALGRVLTKNHTEHGTTYYEYDLLGRITREEADDNVNEYTYVSEGNGLGQVQSVRSSNIATLIYDYIYDEFGRVIQKEETIGSNSYSMKYKYDDLGRVDKTIYPDGFSIVHDYNDYGYLKGINKSDGSKIWEVKGFTTYGKPEQIEYGNGLVTDFAFNDDYRPTEIKTYQKSSASTICQQLSFEWDHETGNLTNREDVLHGLSEDFTYDNLDRLVSYQVSGVQRYTMSYNNDLDGAIDYKKGMGNYTYNEGSSAHAFNSISPDTEDFSWADQYDGLYYNSYNKVEQIVRDDYDIIISYGPDRKRKKVDNFKNHKPKLYVGGLYEIEDPNGTNRKLHYIPGPDGEAAIYVSEGSSTGQMYYIHKDYLGSYQTITDENGDIATLDGVEQVYSFDPWGRRRNASTWDYESLPTDFLFARGFTGHEHMDELTLINMNGRFYDPLTATFLSPDPYVQAPDYTQNYNRYGYAFGNPLIYTDPSGYITWWDVGAGAMIVGGVALIIFTGGAAAPPVLLAIGKGLVLGGVVHFGYTAQETFSGRGTWDENSTYFGLQASITFNFNLGKRQQPQLPADPPKEDIEDILEREEWKEATGRNDSESLESVEVTTNTSDRIQSSGTNESTPKNIDPIYCTPYANYYNDPNLLLLDVVTLTNKTKQTILKMNYGYYDAELSNYVSKSIGNGPLKITNTNGNISVTNKLKLGNFSINTSLTSNVFGFSYSKDGHSVYYSVDLNSGNQSWGESISINNITIGSEISLKQNPNAFRAAGFALSAYYLGPYLGTSLSRMKVPSPAWSY